MAGGVNVSILILCIQTTQIMPHTHTKFLQNNFNIENKILRIPYLWFDMNPHEMKKKNFTSKRTFPSLESRNTSLAS